jgi:hypothetical protein
MAAQRGGAGEASAKARILSSVTAMSWTLKSREVIPAFHSPATVIRNSFFMATEPIDRAAR